MWLAYQGSVAPVSICTGLHKKVAKTLVRGRSVNELCRHRQALACCVASTQHSNIHGASSRVRMDSAFIMISDLARPMYQSSSIACMGVRLAPEHLRCTSYGSLGCRRQVCPAMTLGVRRAFLPAFFMVACTFRRPRLPLCAFVS